MEPANDQQPLVPLTFLAAAIRAEINDARRVSVESFGEHLARLERIEKLCDELDRYESYRSK